MLKSDVMVHIHPWSVGITIVFCILPLFGDVLIHTGFIGSRGCIQSQMATVTMTKSVDRNDY